MNTEKVNIETVREVVEIKRMFDHIRKSVKVWSFPVDNLKFFGFPGDTPHFHIFRAIELNDEEINLEWRYRDMDSNGLVRCQAMLSVYKAITDQETRDTCEVLTESQLATLDQVSKRIQQAA